MAERPKLRHSQHGPSWASVSTYHTIQEEVRLHSNYIRDTVAPLLAQERRLSDSDTHLMQSILQRIKTLPVTLDLLQYSRMEKALMVITADGELNWPIAIVEQAKGILKEWEEDLGPLQNIRADLFAIGGRLEGVTRTTYWTSGASYENSDTKSVWTVESQAEQPLAWKTGHIGFEVGDWWLTPVTAFRDGIISTVPYGITFDLDTAYAILLTGTQETPLNSDGSLIKFTAAPYDRGVYALCKTFASQTEKPLRILRSCNLSSKFAPKGGLRYDGLYRTLSYSLHRKEATNEWTYAFTLARLPCGTQPALSTVLHISTSDQMDDWDDYNYLKEVSAEKEDGIGALLEGEGGVAALDGERGRTESVDSGYFSRQG